MQFLKFGGGRNFYLKDFRNAYQFRPDVAPPRQKFQGYVNFIPNRTILQALSQGTDSSALRTRLGSLVRTAQLPELQVQTQVVNSFNRKKTITTGREYAPITLTLFQGLISCSPIFWVKRCFAENALRKDSPGICPLLLTDQYY